MSNIGETGRTLQLKIKEHKRALTNGDPCMSALAEHAINHHHDIAWEDVIAEHLKHGISVKILIQ